jgi:hypothetical protein
MCLRSLFNATESHLDTRDRGFYGQCLPKDGRRAAGGKDRMESFAGAEWKALFKASSSLLVWRHATEKQI